MKFAVPEVLKSGPNAALAIVILVSLAWGGIRGYQRVNGVSEDPGLERISRASCLLTQDRVKQSLGMVQRSIERGLRDDPLEMAMKTDYDFALGAAGDAWIVEATAREEGLNGDHWRIYPEGRLENVTDGCADAPQ